MSGTSWAVGGQRHYGLSIGDIVEERAFGCIRRGVVVAFYPTDNNRAVVDVGGGIRLDVISEWCTIIDRCPV